MKNTLEERLMAFMNCPWKNTAECNHVCGACIRSSPEGFKGLLDEIERLSRLIEKKLKEEKDNA